MNTLELIKVIETLKRYYNKDVVMIKGIVDSYDRITIETLYGDLLSYERRTGEITKVEREG